ncbi:MAG: hypothetical protein ACR2RD_06680 [Woeseiaceae bacterium]
MRHSMDSNYIKQHFLIDRYLRGTLENGERDAFEERLVWDKSLIDELDLAERLRENLRDAAKTRESVAKSRGFDLVAMVTGFLTVPQYAAASSFVLAAMLTAGVLLNPSVDIDGSQGDSAAQTEIVPLLAVRGASVQTINVDENARTVLLVDVIGNYASYRVTIRKNDSDGEPIWQKDKLTPTYLDALAISMQGDALGAGHYVLSLEGTTDGDSGEKKYEKIQDIPFESAAAE